jgi:uncharacterized membrane protein YhaH (DUF805 family)
MSLIIIIIIIIQIAAGSDCETTPPPPKKKSQQMSFKKRPLLSFRVQTKRKCRRMVEMKEGRTTIECSLICVYIVTIPALYIYIYTLLLMCTFVCHVCVCVKGLHPCSQAGWCLLMDSTTYTRRYIVMTKNKKTLCVHKKDNV